MSLSRESRSVIASLFRGGDRRTSACWIGLDRQLLSHGISLPTDGTPPLLSRSLLNSAPSPGTLIKTCRQSHPCSRFEKILSVLLSLLSTRLAVITCTGHLPCTTDDAAVLHQMA
jgi:hypothetical protein